MFTPVVIVAALVVCTSACAPSCHCKWMHGKPSVTCVRGNLTAVPLDLESNTEVLDLSGNHLRFINNSAFMHAGLLNLQRLNLSSCDINSIDERAFHGLEPLVDLDLSHNNLTAIAPHWFNATPYLRQLLLAGNPLTSLADNSFGSLYQLKVLELRDCNIVEIATRAFVGLESSLRKLDLSRNKLQTVDVRALAPLRSLVSLELVGNPWECSCELLAVRDWISTRSISTSGMVACEGVPHGTCAAPDVSSEVSSDMTVECRISGLAAARMRWSHDGRPLTDTSGTGAPITLRTDAQTSTLTIKSTQQPVKLGVTIDRENSTPEHTEIP